MNYCNYIPTLPTAERRALHQYYHDHLYGFPLHDDNELFGRLLLEINQAGLSWETVLRKAPALRRAYADFQVDRVAAFTEADTVRLLSDASIIRNRLKIEAAIHNARVVVRLQQEHGSFYRWLAVHHPLSKAEWVKLFKQHFRFVGGEIVGEFLMSIGFLPGAHDENCPIYKEIMNLRPMWAQI